MSRHIDNKRLRFPGFAPPRVGWPDGLLGMLPIPLLHGLTGSSGIWDEIISLGLIGGIIFALLFAVLGIRGKGKRRDEE